MAEIIDKGDRIKVVRDDSNVNIYDKLDSDGNQSLVVLAGEEGLQILKVSDSSVLETFESFKDVTNPSTDSFNNLVDAVDDIIRNISFGRASGVLHSSVTVPVDTTTISLIFDTNPVEKPLKNVELIGGLGGSQIKSLIDGDVVLNFEPQFNRTPGGAEESIIVWSERSIDNGITWVKELAIEVELKGGDTMVAPLTAVLCCKNDRARFRAQGTIATTLEFVTKAAGAVTSDHPIIPAYILTIS